MLFFCVLCVSMLCLSIALSVSLLILISLPSPTLVSSCIFVSCIESRAFLMYAPIQIVPSYPSHHLYSRLCIHYCSRTLLLLPIHSILSYIVPRSTNTARVPLVISQYCVASSPPSNLPYPRLSVPVRVYPSLYYPYSRVCELLLSFATFLQTLHNVFKRFYYLMHTISQRKVSPKELILQMSRDTSVVHLSTPY